jgi:hypothetical protein
MIRIEVNTGNDAFLPETEEGWRQETAWILHDLADRILTGQALPVLLRDCNGNRVGLCERDCEDSRSIPGSGSVGAAT